MKRDEIMAVINGLAKSQGFYSRMAMTLGVMQTEDPAGYDRIMSELEAQNFKDSVDLVIYLET